MHKCPNDLAKYKWCLRKTCKVVISKFHHDCQHTDHNFCRMVIIIKSNPWLTRLGASTSNTNVIKEAYKWIILLNNSQQRSQHESGENRESFKVGDWLGWKQPLSRECMVQGFSGEEIFTWKDSSLSPEELWVAGHWSY